MSEQQAPVASPQVEEVGTKVFVGNLSFATKDAEIHELFSKVGEIINAAVINRGARSLGYGFVTYVNQADAEKAISTLDKSEIAGRQINVEAAKPPTAQTPRAPRAAAEPRAPVIGEDGEVVESAAPKKRKPRTKAARGGAKGGRRPRTDGETEEAGDAPTEAMTSQLAATTLETKDGETAAPRGGRPPRAPRAPRPTPVRRGAPTGLASTTLLFVANLPFSVTDESLKGLFDGFKVVNARVVVKKFGPGEGRSKGFGFVDFENEEEQKRALENVNGKEIDGREVQLKIAVSHEEKTEEAEALVVAS